MAIHASSRLCKDGIHYYIECTDTGFKQSSPTLEAHGQAYARLLHAELLTLLRQDQKLGIGTTVDHLIADLYSVCDKIADTIYTNPTEASAYHI